VKLDPKTSRSAVMVLLALALLAVVSCSGGSGNAPDGENASTDETTQASLSPDPAFNHLLPTLRQMTTAPIMLPASLPEKVGGVAIEKDPNKNPYTTGGDRYTIMFLYSKEDATKVTQPYVHYMTLGTLTASPVNAPLLPELSNELGKPHQLDDVTLPDGTAARLKRLVPPRGANYGPFTVGTFEKEGYRYTVSIEDDTPNGGVTREILSTMVKVPAA
jgi:hypothetical protein